MKKIVLLTLIFALTSVIFCEQTIMKNNTTMQWEYMVISIGKTYFGSPIKGYLYSELLNCCWY